MMQQRFVEEYLIDLNATHAAIRAGFRVHNASGTGTALLRHGPVRDAIARAMAARSKRVGISQDRVLQHLGALVFGDPSSIFNEHGGLRRPHELDQWDRRLIAGVKTRRIIAQQPDGTMAPEEITEVKVVDNIAATQLLMRHLGMMNDKLDINVTSLADRLRAAQLRRMGVNVDSDDGPVIDAEIEGDEDIFGEAQDQIAAPSPEVNAGDALSIEDMLE